MLDVSTARRPGSLLLEKQHRPECAVTEHLKGLTYLHISFFLIIFVAFHEDKLVVNVFMASFYTL